MITKQTYSDQVAEYIKARILEGELAPGDQVKEMVLAERLGISRAPVREALQILMREGLISSEPQRGKFIRALTGKEIKDAYFIGGVLEGAAVAVSLERFTDDDLACLDALVNAMRATAATASSMLEFAGLDNEFHDTLLARADNPGLTELARRSCLNISKFLFYNRWRTLYTPEEYCARHELILDAVRSKDPALVEKTLRDHYTESGERMARFGAQQQ
ncbi:GntR family transcriptional regulator [Desulfovibrio sp. OttesenSCG-928-I05]|nr:GntR family transcriptional regulator [Desulfovibrio sp. OttesenSCG-928-I05]